MIHTDAKCIRREDGDYAAGRYDHKRPLGHDYGLTATGMHFFFEVTGMQFCLVSTVG